MNGTINTKLSVATIFLSALILLAAGAGLMRKSTLIPQKDIYKLDDMLKSYAEVEAQRLATHERRLRKIPTQFKY